MNILVISNLFPPHGLGGYELICAAMCSQLAGLGHEVRVLTSDHRLAGKPEHPTLQVCRELRIHGYYGHPWLPIHQLYQLEAHNHRVLQRQLRDWQPDVVYLWNLGGVSKSLIHRLQDSGVPYAFYISDHWIAASLEQDVWLKWWNSEGSIATTSAKSLVSLAGGRKWLDCIAPTHPVSRMRFAHLSFCSAYLRDLTAAKGYPVAHAEVIHSTVDTAAFTVKSDFSSFSRLLWVGRLVDDKDPITAVRAVASARSCGLAGLSLDLIGHGDADYVARLEGEIQRLQLGHCITIRSVRAEEMPDLYHRYDALLFTSNWGEPFALTPLEAMASGLPVITTTDGGQVELARHGENSLIANAADHESFAGRLAELAASPGLRMKLAENSLAEVRDSFDIRIGARKVEALLRKAVEAKEG